MTRRFTRSFRERFEEKCVPEPNSGCWLWIASIKGEGYGQIGTGVGDSKRPVLAHRAAWTIYVGPIPPGMFVLHRCDQRLCVNPDHLRLGTHVDNMLDMVAKGRSSGKMTIEQVREIRRLADAGEAKRSIARRFGLNRGTVANIVTRKFYREVTL